MRSAPLLIACTSLLFAAAAPHGTQYTPPPVYGGPSDVVPGAGAGPGLGSPVGGGAVPPGPSTPNAGAGTGAGAPAGPSTPEGSDFDTSTWELWWHYNSSSYLDPRRTLRVARPSTGSDDDFLSRSADAGAPSGAAPFTSALPLLAELASGDGPDQILASTAIALGKASKLEPEGAGDASALLLRLLADRKNEVAESAVAALGIRGDEAGVELLEALVLGDTGRLRTLAPKAFALEVPPRIRAFAACALAVSCEELGGYWHLRGANALRRVALETDAAVANEDVRCACVFALGSMRLPVANSAPYAESSDRERPLLIASRADQLACLLSLAADSRAGARLRAQAPVAAARIVAGLPRESPLRRVASARLAALATDQHFAPSPLRASCVLALGQMGLCGTEAIDRELVRAVSHAARRDPDVQTRGFALLALGELRASADGDVPGTEKLAGECAAELARELSRAETRLRCFAALGLGLGERGLRRSGRAATSDDVQIALRMALEEARSPSEIGALAIALGLAGDPSASEALLEKIDLKLDPRTQGYLAVGVGMLGADGARQRLAEIARRARNDPELLPQVAIGLALLGDFECESELVLRLRSTDSATARAGLAQALGWVGGDRAAAALSEIAADRSTPAIVRDYAVAALGRIVADTDRPWNARLAHWANYVAAPTVVANPVGGDGVLDIL